MRKINKLVIHCSDSDRNEHDNIATIRKWHVVERGFHEVGYHYVITKDGEAIVGRPESMIGAHVAGHNTNSIAICMIGKNFFSDLQFKKLKGLIQDIAMRYNLGHDNIIAHHDLDPGKTCPNFDVKKFVAGIKL